MLPTPEGALRVRRAALVVGGGGFVGRRLVAQLLAGPDYDTVHLLDVHNPREAAFTPAQRLRLRCFTGSICDLDTVKTAARGCQAIFHLAAVGMSGSEQLKTRFVEEINVKGTDTVIEAALAVGVSRLIYCSTYNVVFAGNTILQGDESAPYVSESAFVDAYSRTKAAAEQRVLAANGARGKPAASASAGGAGVAGTTLWTAAVRPAAIYGDGEERHLPRILHLLKAGLGFFSVGAADLLCDWVYVDNFTHALALADRALRAPAEPEGSSSPPRGGAGTGPSGRGASPSGPRGRGRREAADPGRSDSPMAPVAAGQAYFISDDAPVNNFAFLARLFEPLGYRNLFEFRVPTGLMYALACCVEACFFALSALGICLPIPGCMMTRAEVCKVGYSHYFSMRKARRELGYVPPVSVDEAVRRCAGYLREEGFAIDVKAPVSGFKMAWLLVLAALLLAALVPLFLHLWASMAGSPVLAWAAGGQPGGGGLLRSGFTPLLKLIA